MALCPPQIPCGLLQDQNHLCHGAAFKKVKISLPVLLQNGCNDPTVGTAALHKVNVNKFTNTYTTHLDKHP
jgi:hypothetical protein